MVNNEKFQCPSERGGPEDFSNYPTFVPSAIFGGVMASQNMVNFFWDTLYVFMNHKPDRMFLSARIVCNVNTKSNQLDFNNVKILYFLIKFSLESRIFLFIVIVYSYFIVYLDKKE